MLVLCVTWNCYLNCTQNILQTHDDQLLETLRKTRVCESESSIIWSRSQRHNLMEHALFNSKGRNKNRSSKIKKKYWFGYEPESGRFVYTYAINGPCQRQQQVQHPSDQYIFSVSRSPWPWYSPIIIMTIIIINKYSARLNSPPWNHLRTQERLHTLHFYKNLSKLTGQLGVRYVAVYHQYLPTHSHVLWVILIPPLEICSA